MAIMCPDTPRNCTLASREEELFNILRDGLPNDYYVFHSFSILDVDSGLEEHEIDFVIFHPQKGVLIVEAKNGHVKYEGGRWLYGNGVEMNHDGPFHQASLNKHFLMKKIANELSELGRDIIRRCKFQHAVWFPALTDDDIAKSNLPIEADKKIIITSDDISYIDNKISSIMDLPLIIQGYARKTDLRQRDIDLILEKILAPVFNVVSIAGAKKNYQSRVFKSLMKEQIALLNYLEEQNIAVINGRAGTGKTVMALEKAKRHALLGEKVLFLTYNAMLNDWLRKNHEHKFIDFYNIDKLAAKFGKCKYDELLNYILDEDKLPWQHIIVDEGQDFGRDELDDILTAFQERISGCESKNASFYVFYDRNQLVQGDKVPLCIQEADCKLTLYKNCRNTYQIADTAEEFLRHGLGDLYRAGKTNEEALISDRPSFYIVNDDEEVLTAVNLLIEENLSVGYDNIQILTCCSPLENSSIVTSCSHGYYKYKNKAFPVTTSRKFKGLEADCVILTDVNMDIFSKNIISKKWDDSLTAYVGITRARFRLGIIANFTTDECNQILIDNGYKKTKTPEKAVAKKVFHADYKEI